MDHLKAPRKLSQVLNELQIENISKFRNFHKGNWTILSVYMLWQSMA